MAVAAVLLATGFFTVPARAEQPYVIGVDITNQIVTVYKADDGTVVRQMLCSTGKYKPTPQGTFTLPAKRRKSERTEWYQFPVLDCYAKWATRIVDKILFHSITYDSPTERGINREAVERFGRPASHGCVRLLVEDAKWIAKNCLAGTKVRIYKSGKRDDELRAMLRLGTFTIDDGISYNRFLGLPEEEGELGRHSTGIEVSNLQYRLRDLGVFDGEPDGEYETDTFVAVRKMQVLMGRDVTGTATLEFQEAVFADDAPTAMAITLDIGHGGPVVRNLQQELTDLKLYSGPLDSIYDNEVAESVKLFQQAYGYLPADGAASPEVQQAIYYESGKVQLMFARSEGFRMRPSTYALTIGRISAQTGIRIREKASTNSEALGRLVDGNLVIVLDRGEYWSKIRYGDSIGYVKNVFLEFTDLDMSVLTYSATDSSLEYSIGKTAEEYYDGGSLPASTLSDYLASGGSLDSYDEIASYIRVNTDGPEVTLNLRETPSTNSAILAALPYGAEARVLLNSTEWTLVEYEGMNGYVRNEYVEFLGDPIDEQALEAGLDLDAEEVFAVVQPANGSSAAVYDADSDDADVLGHLGGGAKVQIIRALDDWDLISYEGHQGYMREEDLKYLDEIEG